MSRATCGSCSWWDGMGCHKRAPVVVTDPHNRNGSGYTAAYPRTEMKDWCGDYSVYYAEKENQDD